MSLGNTVLGGDTAAALATHAYGVSALGAPGSGSLGLMQIAGHMPMAGMDALSSGALGGSAAEQYPQEYKSHPNVINEQSDGPIMANRFLTAPAAHMIPGQDDLVFIHKPKQEGMTRHPDLVGAMYPRSAAYATGAVAQEMDDLRSLIGLNPWALNYFLAAEQVELWLTDPERAALLTPAQIWHGVNDLWWTGFTCDGVCRLEELANQTPGNISNDGYATFTPFKITEKTPRAPKALKLESIVRAGRTRMRDLWGGRGNRAGAALHLVLTARPGPDDETLTFVTTAKSETMQAVPTAVTSTVTVPTVEEFQRRAKDPSLKLTKRAREMLEEMKQAPRLFQLYAYSHDNGGDVPLSFRVYEDPWKMPHYDGLPLRVGKILHPAYATPTEPGIRDPSDPGFAPIANGFDAMRKMLITSVVLDACKDGHMALA
jgi:hypothetical protein